MPERAVVAMRVKRILWLLAAVAPCVGAQTERLSSPATQAALSRYIETAERPADQRARDRFRHPLETLSFCGIEPDMTVVEIWPGGQGMWYRRIVEPLIEAGGGRYIPVANRSAFPDRMDTIPYGQVDLVLVFRAHGFMIYSKPAQRYVDAIYDMLRPGGIHCIVDHAGDESVPQDPKGENGYVNESHYRRMAEKTGFVLQAISDHNRNPLDTKDHPHGVWSLPPTLAGSEGDPDARSRYLEIGESDRFTHKYYKGRTSSLQRALRWLRMKFD